MVKKITASLFLICLFISIPLAVMGIKHVEPGPAFLNFMQNVDRDMYNYHLEIPDIPHIPLIENPNFFLQIVNYLSWIVNIFIDIINFVIVWVLNILFGILQAIFWIVAELIALVKSLIETGSTDNPYWPSSLPSVPIL